MNFNVLSRWVSRIGQQQFQRVMASSGEKEGAPASTLAAPLNRLAAEQSPYLLQHATNPVDWYPWGEEAFELARRENRLIFLSVGYSTCHWCHVMERESFENPDIAKIMNTNFVNVKVDREERPDVDKVYMTFVTSLSGGGGWPMSVWLTPELKPIYGGTYFPPNNRYFGRPSFPQLLESIASQWRDDQEKFKESGGKIMEVLDRTSRLPAPGTEELPGEEPIAKCLAQLTRAYETEYGGFSEAPKFPQPSNFNFLFTYYALNPHLEDAKHGLAMALHTLSMMARGGIHDHVAQGFARYSTDQRWHVPHFEKMLYDQAQLTHSFLDACIVSGQSRHSLVARDILSYVMRDLSHPVTFQRGPEGGGQEETDEENGHVGEPDADAIKHGRRNGRRTASSRGMVRAAFSQVVVRARYQVRGSAGGFLTFRESGNLTLTAPTVFLTTRLGLILPPPTPPSSSSPQRKAKAPHRRHGGRVKIVRVRNEVTTAPTTLILQPAAHPPQWVRQQVQTKLEELSGDLSHGHGAVRMLLHRWGKLLKKLIHRTARAIA